MFARAKVLLVFVVVLVSLFSAVGMADAQLDAKKADWLCLRVAKNNTPSSYKKLLFSSVP